jgi:hypothetical protein
MKATIDFACQASASFLTLTSGDVSFYGWVAA